LTKNKNYKGINIPNPFCCPKVQPNLRVLGRQRDRWTRGTMESLFIHFKLFFNPRYKSLGLLGHPYWFFFEWLAPIFEFIGIIYFIIIAFLGIPNWSFFFMLLATIYFFAVTLTHWAILFEELSFHRYKRIREVIKMLMTAMLEPIFYHPFILAFNIRGNFKYFIGEKTWGAMDRVGFTEKDSKNDKK